MNLLKQLDFSSGTYLFSGSSNGELYIFDLKSTNDDEPLASYARLTAHSSALCGVRFVSFLKKNLLPWFYSGYDVSSVEK